MDAAPIVPLYDRLLASVGDHAADIGSRPVVTHWPHVGSAYQGHVIVGQAVFGWADDSQASDLQSAATMINSIRSRVDKPEPLDWIATHSRRNTPFWKMSRLVAEALEPAMNVPWYARFAWVNLYPSAPEDPPDNPRGALEEAQRPHVGGLLRTVIEVLDARRIVAVVGPYWRSAAGSAGLAGLPEQPRPLLAAGRSDGKTWSLAGIRTAPATGTSARRLTPRSSLTPFAKSRVRPSHDCPVKINAVIGSIPADWRRAIGQAGSSERLGPIADFVAARQNTLPSPDRVFAALEATPFGSVCAVILGQDPYPTRTHAMGLAFSVPRDLTPPLPRSLQNIRAELQSDGGWAVPEHGSLEAWTGRGVLLLNTTLTVQEGAPGSRPRSAVVGPGNRVSRRSPRRTSRSPSCCGASRPRPTAGSSTRSGTSSCAPRIRRRCRRRASWGQGRSVERTRASGTATQIRSTGAWRTRTESPAAHGAPVSRSRRSAT